MLNTYQVLSTLVKYKMQKTYLVLRMIIGYQLLTRMGYKNIRRYAGGIEEWEEAGYPLEGSFVS
jgi:3-mercaptopyruvate sulfurtransferase SseA